MRNWLRYVALAAGMGVAAHAAAQIAFYEHNDFRGRTFTVDRAVNDFFNFGFNDRASSVAIRGGSWQLCSDANFRGRCVTLNPGEYPDLAAVGLNDQVSSARPVGGGGPVAGGPPRGRIELFDYGGFGGRGITLDGDVVNMEQIGFNDRANSAVVHEGTWQLCEHEQFRGSCITIGPGRYPDLGGLSGAISSARMVASAPVARPVAPPAPPPGRAVLFGRRGLEGPSLVIDRSVVRNLTEFNFNDRASSLRVESGYWMFCSDANFEGECRTFGPGDYPVLPPELNNRISSGRRISNQYPYREAPSWVR